MMCACGVENEAAEAGPMLDHVILEFPLVFTEGCGMVTPMVIDSVHIAGRQLRKSIPVPYQTASAVNGQSHALNAARIP